MLINQILLDILNWMVKHSCGINTLFVILTRILLMPALITNIKFDNSK